MEFEQLAANYSNMIHSIIHSLKISRNEDEFYQIGLIALWSASQKDDRQKGKFSGYAYQSIRGEMLMHLQNENKRTDENGWISEDHIHQLYSQNPEPLELETLLSNFRHLTDLQKKWVTLRYYYGYSNKDIAEIKKTNLLGVKSCGRLAMQKFIGVK